MIDLNGRSMIDLDGRGMIDLEGRASCYDTGKATRQIERQTGMHVGKQAHTQPGRMFDKAAKSWGLATSILASTPNQKRFLSKVT